MHVEKNRKPLVVFRSRDAAYERDRTFVDQRGKVRRIVVRQMPDLRSVAGIDGNRIRIKRILRIARKDQRSIGCCA